MTLSGVLLGIAWAATPTNAFTHGVWVGTRQRALNSVGIGSCNFGGILIPAEPAFQPRSDTPALTILLPRRGGGDRIRMKDLMVEIRTPEGIILETGTLFLDYAMLTLPEEAWRLFSTCVVEQVPIDRLRGRMSEVSRVDRSIILGLLVQTADLRGQEIDLSGTTVQHYLQCKRHGRCDDFISEAIVPAFSGTSVSDGPGPSSP